MPNRRIVWIIILAAVSSFSLLALAQTPQPIWNSMAPPAESDAVRNRPAPRRDLSGIWDPAVNAIGADGAQNMPSDGRPEHALPYTSLGEEAFDANKPAWGVTGVPSALSNDPVPLCDPQGFPRIVLHNFRTSQIFQTANQVIILYEFNKKWRVIWTNGRELPEMDELEPRWWGYSVGRWEDDYTFVAETVGLNESTWLDNAGRPHSSDLRVVERYRRLDHDRLEMTITIDDPTFYTQPWIALDKLPLALQPSNFDIREMECSPSETERYNRLFGDPAAGVER